MSLCTMHACIESVVVGKTTWVFVFLLVEVVLSTYENNEFCFAIMRGFVHL